MDIKRETPVSLTELARRFNKDPRTVRNWTTREENPLYAEPVGGQWTTTLEEVERWMQACRKKKLKAVRVAPCNKQHAAAEQRLKEVYRI